MKSPLEQIQELEEVIRQLHKIDSKLIAGQEVLAYREVNSLLAFFERRKKEIIQEAKRLEENKQWKIMGMKNFSLIKMDLKT